MDTTRATCTTLKLHMIHQTDQHKEHKEKELNLIWAITYTKASQRVISLGNRRESMNQLTAGCKFSLLLTKIAEKITKFGSLFTGYKINYKIVSSMEKGRQWHRLRDWILFTSLKVNAISFNCLFSNWFAKWVGSKWGKYAKGMYLQRFANDSQEWIEFSWIGFSLL